MKKHSGSLYDYTAGVACGVLVKERVMKKLAALQAKHLDDVKRILSDGADNGDVFPSMWTLHYPGGVQTHVSYIDESANVRDRIDSAVTQNKPIHKPLVFIAKSMDEARSYADEHYSKTHIDGEGGENEKAYMSSEIGKINKERES